MRHLPHALALALVAALASASPGLAEDQDGTGGFPIILSAPGPRAMLDGAIERLRARDVPGAARDIEATQNRLINESMAGRRPAEVSVASLRDAVPVLDRARQALARGDLAAAGQALAEARAML